MCCGPDSSLVCSARALGLTTKRLTLETGFDFLSESAVQKALQRVETHRPRKAWCSPPCTKWSLLQNLTKRNHVQKLKLARERARSQKLIHNCVDILLRVAARGGDIYYEWPRRCTGWKISELQVLRSELAKMGKQVTDVRIDGCMYGMLDLSGKGLLRKPWKVVTTDALFAEQVGRTCDHSHTHTVIEGRETSRSAFYPRRMASAIAHLWARELLCDQEKTDDSTERSSQSNSSSTSSDWQ